MEEEKKGPFPHAYSLVAPLCLRIKLCLWLGLNTKFFKYDNLTFIGYCSYKKKSPSDRT